MGTGRGLPRRGVERWQPDDEFDAVVFNECPYLERPLETVATYRRALAPGGVFVVSMVRTPRSDAIRRRVPSVVPRRDEAVVCHRDAIWVIGIYGET
jgi:SAM-dependent methyltransferase